MCVQYRGGAQYRRGVHYRGGDIMRTVRGYLEYHGGVQYHGGHHDKCADILSTVGVFSTMGGYHEYRGGYLDYRGRYHDARGGYHEYCGGVQYNGRKNLLLFEYLMVLNTPSPHCTHDIPPQYSNFKEWYPSRY